MRPCCLFACEAGGSDANAEQYFYIALRASSPWRRACPPTHALPPTHPPTHFLTRLEHKSLLKLRLALLDAAGLEEPYLQLALRGRMWSEAVGRLLASKDR